MAEFAIGRPASGSAGKESGGGDTRGRGMKKRYSLASMNSRRSLLEGLGRSTASDIGGGGGCTAAASVRSKRSSLASVAGSQRSLISGSLVFEGFGSATDVQGASAIQIPRMQNLRENAKADLRCIQCP